MTPYRQITIVGCGLVGGSIALAAKQHSLAERVIGCDRADVLLKANARGALDAGDPDPISAAQGSDLVILCTPVGAILDLIERLGPVLPPQTFITDVGSTKAEIVSRAKSVFGAGVAGRFLGGHPMAGKEHGGIEHADAELFRGAKWLITPGADSAADSPGAQRFVQFVQAFGADPVTLHPEAHDKLCAWISHLPQMIATALANSIADFDQQFRQSERGEGAINGIGGRALSEMTRIASSPYSMWRDIALTNTANIEEALHALEQKLAHIRENLRSPELREEFQKANKFKLTQK